MYLARIYKSGLLNVALLCFFRETRVYRESRGSQEREALGSLVLRWELQPIHTNTLVIVDVVKYVILYVPVSGRAWSSWVRGVTRSPRRRGNTGTEGTKCHFCYCTFMSLLLVTFGKVDLISLIFLSRVNLDYLVQGDQKEHQELAFKGRRYTLVSIENRICLFFSFHN